MSDMRLQMIITGNNRGLNQTLGQSDANVRRFTDGAATHFTRMQSRIQRTWNAINGMSAATKLVAAGIGAGTLKSVIDDNLEFERTLLRIKFTAGMTTKELAEMRDMALGLSKSSLNTPLEIAQMQYRLAGAGLKIEDIRKLAPTVANAAQVFDAPAGEIADLVFDKITKSSIRNERIPQMLDMLYYHGTSGRFETMAMAREAPKLLNAGALVGLNNEAGLNLMGALTQRMMRNATVQNPQEVTTLIEHGLSHIVDPHYVKNLKKAGIDVPSYFDSKGHFKGEGGVDGILGLTRAMIAKGLENPFKMGQAGFREAYTKTFWLEMMRSLKAADTDKDPNLLKMMERGREAMNSGQLAVNLATMREATFGKIRAAEIEISKMKLSQGAQDLTTGAGTLANIFSDHPMATAGAAVGAVVAGKYLMNKLLNGRGAGAAMGGAAGAAAGVVPVFVTNWPGSLTGPERASQRMARMQGGAGAAEGASAAGGAAAARTGLATLAMRAAGVAGAALLLSGDSGSGPKVDRDKWLADMDAKMAKQGMHREEGWLFDSYVPDKPGAKSGGADQVATEVRKLGDKLDALNSRPIVNRVEIDGRQVAESVNQVNARDARRQ
jgi:hypothetical protein